MPGHVEDVAIEIASQGKQVEVFNTAYQSNEIFIIEGNSYTWQNILDDFDNLNGQYATNPTNPNWILNSDLPNTLMYKANEIWTNKLLNQGYEIIDIGYPSWEQTQSVFYTMELNNLF